ncbi:hypothetical protein [Rhizobiales bacterium]|uniref:hypothetical protein n=1 Tax=Ensifer sp. R-19 TaxID=3404055 RepID=UPI000DDAE1D3
MSTAPSSPNRRGFPAALTLLLALTAVVGSLSASAAIATSDQGCWYAFKKGVNKPGDHCTESGSLQNDRDEDRENAALSATRTKK